MGKSSKDKDRRAVVEQMRRDQERAERKRTIAIISACALVALVIVGLAVYPLLQDDDVSSGALGSIGASASKAGCQDITTAPAKGSAVHEPVGKKVDYEDAPPAFGPHYPSPAPITRKFYTEDDRPPVEYLVHNLEHGYNILWYDETIADNDELRDEVEAIAGNFPGASDPRNKFIAAPWTSDDGAAFPKGTHVALTHWSVGGSPQDQSKQEGIWQYCKAPSGEAVASFVQDYPYTDSPEPNAA